MTMTHRIAAGLGTLALAAGAATIGAPAQAQLPADGGSTTAAEACNKYSFQQDTCAEAVAWARNKLGTSSSSYTGYCMRIMSWAYGLTNSGFADANAGWEQTPSQYRHAGDRSVPAGGLAYFRSSTHGHVMISLGNGYFGSTDINGSGTFSRTTIAQVESKWGQTYRGWSQPYFASNH